MPSDPILVMSRLAQILEGLGVPYVVGGSIASSAHGLPRATMDVDLVADLRAERVAALVAALEGEFYIDAESVRDALRRRSSFSVIHLPTMCKADVFILQPRPWARAEMARRELAQLDPDDDTTRTYVCSPEDIILHKLDWYRQGGGVSDRQWGDVLGVLKVQGEALEFDYLRHWAAELGLTDLLERALGEAGLTRSSE